VNTRYPGNRSVERKFRLNFLLSNDNLIRRIGKRYVHHAASESQNMNSLYSLCRRQVTSLQTDLTELETIATTTGTTASLNGQITASLSALNRTIEDYDNMARREIVEVHKEKAMA
jgi:hypothetical protein